MSAGEETGRQALALIRACITKDREGKDVIVAHLPRRELERLAIALAGYAGHLMQQPAADANAKLDGMFRLLDDLAEDGAE